MWVLPHICECCYIYVAVATYMWVLLHICGSCYIYAATGDAFGAGNFVPVAVSRAFRAAHLLLAEHLEQSIRDRPVVLGRKGIGAGDLRYTFWTGRFEQRFEQRVFSDAD